MKYSLPEISVILPYYNAGSTLGRAIESMLKQDFQHFELILVNNNSTDGSEEIARSYGSGDSRIVLDEEVRQGVAYASNTGAALSRGAFIARMDADDVALPGRLSVQQAYLENHPACGAVGGLVRYVPAEETGTAGFAKYVDWSNTIRSHEEIHRNRFVELPVVNPTLMWRREIQEAHGLYNHGPFPEDYEMLLRWLSQKVMIEKVPQFVLEWYDSPGRLTRTDPAYSHDAFFEVKTGFLAQWLRDHNPFHPEVAIWGASRLSRKRAELLTKYNIKIVEYIDIKQTRQLEKKVIQYEDVPPPGERFILSYIRQGESRERVREFLKSRGYREEVDYLMIS